MATYYQMGNIPKKRHMVFRGEQGQLLAEEIFGTEGFSGIYSILYHYHLPEASRDTEIIGSVAPRQVQLSPLRHRHARTRQLPPGGDPITGRKVLLFNHDVSLAVAAPREPMSYFYKNGTQDEMLFIHEGTGTLESQLGDVDFSEGDYLYIPRGTIYTLKFEGNAGRMFVIEANGSIDTTHRYRNTMGQLLEHAPYWERDFRRPSRLQSRNERGTFSLHLKVGDMLYERILDYHPFDVIGWDGHLYPYAFNIHDFEPHTGRFHVPPTTHQTFEGPNFVICSFVPRQIDWDPQAVPIPYHHSNLDSDEVMYYAAGNYAARRGIEVGSITLHPRGLAHGPQYGASEASLKAPRTTDELAVMVDTFHPLQLADTMDTIDDPAYTHSWSEAKA